MPDPREDLLFDAEHLDYVLESTDVLSDEDALPEIAVDDRTEANRYLRAWIFFAEERDADLKALDDELAQLQAHRDTLAQRHSRRIDYCFAVLKQFLSFTGRKSVELAHGRLGTRKAPERVRFISKDGEIVDDPSRFLAEIGDCDWITVKRTPCMAEIAKSLKADKAPRTSGEGMGKPLAVLDRNEPKFVITLPKPITPTTAEEFAADPVNAGGFQDRMDRRRQPADDGSVHTGCDEADA